MPIVKKIKKNNKQWFEFKNCVEVYTDEGIKKCNRFYFNGFEEVFQMDFSDGNSCKFTVNHRLKNFNNEWIRVDQIEKGFVFNNHIELIDKKFVGVHPTMDMEVPDVHYYVLNNGIHSHNSAFILGQVSEGIEPHRTNYYIKDLQKGKFTVKNKELERLLEEKGYNNDKVWESILKNGGSVQHLEFLSNFEKDVFKTFAELSQKEIIIQAAQRQKFIDQGQSLNIMIHPSIPARDINLLMIEAWKMEIKSLYYQIGVNAAQTFARDILSCQSCQS